MDLIYKMSKGEVIMSVKKTLLIIGLSCLTIFLVACSGNETVAQDEAAFKEKILDFSIRDTADDLDASITSEALIVTEENGNTFTESYVDYDFFVSIAPYINGTHPCYDHSLTGCQSELSEVTLSIHITNEAGDVILDETTQTHKNGFVDLWLPRDDKYEVKISYLGKEAKGEISSFIGDPTCVTTMELS